MEKAFYLRMIITMVITMGLASVGMANEPSTFSVDGTAYFVWNIDGNGTLHVIPLEASTSHFDKSPFYKYRKQIKSVIIEDDFYCDEGFSVIGDNLFKGLDRLESVRFSDKVRSIGESAFEGCTALKEIIIPSTVESIVLPVSNSSMEMVTPRSLSSLPSLPLTSDTRTPCRSQTHTKPFSPI